jgi:outer membrane murein-binding lipoprotein Lpp
MIDTIDLYVQHREAKMLLSGCARRVEELTTEVADLERQIAQLPFKLSPAQLQLAIENRMKEGMNARMAAIRAEGAPL